MKSGKTVLMNLFAGQNGDTDIENRFLDTRREGESETNGQSSMKTYILPFVK